MHIQNLNSFAIEVEQKINLQMELKLCRNAKCALLSYEFNFRETKWKLLFERKRDPTL